MNGSKETFFPKEINLGKECLYWSRHIKAIGCMYPKLKLQGRISCEGIVDEVCLFIKDGRNTDKISEADKIALKTTPPNLDNNLHIPAEK